MNTAKTVVVSQEIPYLALYAFFLYKIRSIDFDDKLRTSEALKFAVKKMI